MKPVSEFKSQIKFLFTDIDDTLTTHGQLGPEAYEALWKLKNKGVKVIPVTGRPAGWCEMIARMWPVAGVVGENGGFYFRYDEKRKKMKRSFVFDFDEQDENRKKLDLIRDEVLSQVPGCAIASDQFCRLMDLAVDFCEDVTPLPPEAVEKIVEIFLKHKAQAKVSSIHVNGWFGEYDKLSQVIQFLAAEFSTSPEEALPVSAFVGDSPNDEPMFVFFPNSFGVSNVLNFKSQIKFMPKFISESAGGKGFAQIAEQILLNIK